MSATKQATPAMATTTRSPPESPRGSYVVNTGRRYSLNIPQEMVQKLERRRASIDKLQVDKVAPWMYLYDFEEKDN